VSSLTVALLTVCCCYGNRWLVVPELSVHGHWSEIDHRWAVWLNGVWFSCRGCVWLRESFSAERKQASLSGAAGPPYCIGIWIPPPHGGAWPRLLRQVWEPLDLSRLQERTRVEFSVADPSNLTSGSEGHMEACSLRGSFLEVLPWSIQTRRRNEDVRSSQRYLQLQQVANWTLGGASTWKKRVEAGRQAGRLIGSEC